jgi:hypothetical protein
METKNENLSKIKKYSDLYKRNIITFDEYQKVVNQSINQLSESNKLTKKLSK